MLCVVGTYNKFLTLSENICCGIVSMKTYVVGTYNKFLTLHENICCGYPQHMFSWRNKKVVYLDSPLIWCYVQLRVRYEECVDRCRNVVFFCLFFYS